MSRVAREAGTSVGALYFRFNDKDTFIAAALRRGFDRIRVETSQLLTRAHEESLPADEVIGRFVAWTVDVISDHQGLFRAVLKQALLQPEAWEPVSQLGSDASAILLDALRGQEAIVRIPEWEARLLFGVGVVRSTVFMSGLNTRVPLPATRAELSRDLTRLVLAHLHA